MTLAADLKALTDLLAEQEAAGAAPEATQATRDRMAALFAKRKARNARARRNRGAMAAAMDSVGARKVRGAMGGTYWE